MSTFPPILKNIFANTWVNVGLIALAVILLFFPHLSFTIGNYPDSALVWFYNVNFTGEGQGLGPFIFPHGPLAYMLHPLPEGRNLFHFFLYFGISQYLLIWLLNYEIKSENSNHIKFLIALIGLLLLVFSPYQLVFYTGIISGFVAFFRTSNRGVLVVTSVLIACNVLIKSDSAVYAILMMIVFLLWLATNKRWRDFMLSLAASGLSLLIIWMLLFGINGLSELPEFIAGNLELLTANEGAMTLVDDQIALLLLGWACLFTVPFIIRKEHNWWLWALLLLPVLAGWRHGIVRCDIYHSAAFFYQMAVFWCFIILLHKRWVLILPFALSISLFFTAFSNSVDGFDKLSWLKNNPQNASRFLTELSSDFADYEESKSYVFDVLRLETKIRQEIGKTAVDIIPTDLFYGAANGLDYNLKPVLQSYAANSNDLDNLNARHFAENGPKFLIWHTNENGRFTSIDGRSSLSDAPQMTEAVLENYQLNQVGQYELILKRKIGESLQWRTTDSTMSRAKSLSSWVRLTDTNLIFRSDIELNSKNVFFEELLLRSKPIFVLLEFENGEQTAERLPRAYQNSMAWLSPNYRIEEGELIKSRVARYRLLCDTFFYESTFNVRTRATDNPLEIEAKFTRSERSILWLDTLDKSHAVETDNYSKQLMWQRDSSTNDSNIKFVRVFASALTRCPVVPDAQLVISIEMKEGEKSEVAYINSLMTGKGMPHFAKSEIYLTQSEWTQTTKLKCYVWNADSKERVELEDMRMGIERIYR